MPNIKAFPLPLRHGPHGTPMICIECTLYTAIAFKTCGLTVSLLSLTTLLFGNEMDLMSNMDISNIWFLTFLSKLGLFYILDRLNSMCQAYSTNAGDFQSTLSYMLVGGGLLWCIKYYQANIYVLKFWTFSNIPM